MKLKMKQYLRYMKILTKCKLGCPNIECYDEIDITHIERVESSPLMLYQTLTDSPSFIVEFAPKVGLADYLTLFHPVSVFGFDGQFTISFFPEVIR